MEGLIKPFSAKDIEWRVQSSGIKQDKSPWALVLAYVTARAVQKRLDDVFGVLGWKDTYRHVPGGVVCSLSCLDKERGEWVTKENGSPETEIEAFKGGISKAFVRVAASGFGIGRYLYDLDTTFVSHNPNGKRYDVIKKKKEKIGEIKWDEPALPKWALPEDEEPKKPTKNEVDPQLFVKYIVMVKEVADESTYDEYKEWWNKPGNGDKIKNVLSEANARKVHAEYNKLLKEKENK